MMTSGKDSAGESPIFTCRAHVFHIDQKTKRSWVPASSSSVNVNFFYDCTRSLYRIISVEGTKAIINSTVTANMSFTKTSQKFGQWSDVRANTIYGLGFNSEFELNKFIEKFQEVKEATRLAQVGSNSNGSTATSISSSVAGSASNTTASPVTSRSVTFNDPGLIEPPQMQATTPGSSTPNTSFVDDSNSDYKSNYPRNQSLTNAPHQVESPKHHLSGGDHRQTNNVPVTNSSSNCTETHLRLENERLKKALANSSANAKQWEIDLQVLNNTNSRLTSALQESTANVDEWKKQLQMYKEENQRLRNRYADLEAAKGYPSGGNESTVDLRKELSLLRLKVETLEVELETKDDEIKRLSSAKAPNEERCKTLTQENSELQSNLSLAQTQWETAMEAHDTQRRVLETLNNQLAARIQDLNSIHKEMSMALQT